MTDTVTFRTNDLLSKWGFEDGDQLDDLLYSRIERGDLLLADGDLDARHSFEHRVLIRVVKEHVAPQLLAHGVELTDICTIHNPIRIERLGGVDVSAEWYNTPRPNLLEPATVDVLVDDILRIAEEEL